MAIVKSPLYSYSAKGSIFGLVTYAPLHRKNKRTVHRKRLGVEVVAQYQPQVIGAGAVAKSKIKSRPDLKRLAALPEQPVETGMRQVWRLFRYAQMIANWTAQNNLTIAPINPVADPVIRYPWWDRKYFQRRHRVEFLQFPNGQKGITTAIRVEMKQTKEKHTLIYRQLMNRRNFRWLAAISQWNNIPAETQALWYPMGNAPWELLDLPLYAPDGTLLHANFVNFWMQLSFLVSEFAQRKDYRDRPRDYEVWITPHRRPPNDPAIIAWLNYLDSDADITFVPVSA